MENCIDVEEMGQWISDRSGIDLETVLTVLDLENEYLDEKELIDSDYDFSNESDECDY